MTSDPELAQAIGLHQAGQLKDAIRGYRTLLRRRRADPQVNHLLGIALFATGKADEGLEFIRAALARAPGHPQLLNDLGNVLRALGRQADAAQAFRDAVENDPGFHFARLNLADCLYEQGRHDEALSAYDGILAARLPGIDADLHGNRGACLAALDRLEEALAAFHAALALQPAHAGAAANAGAALHALGRDEEAVDLLTAFAERHGGRAEVALQLAFAKLQCCDWAELDALRGEVLAAVAGGKVQAGPSRMLGFTDDPDLLKRIATRHAATRFQAHRRAVLAPAPAARVRLAFLSTDYRQHPVARLAVRMLERLDRDVFEVHAVSIGPSGADPLAARIAAGVDRFHDCGAASDEEIVTLLRGLGVDIAVDLNGYTEGARTALFARGLAPVQVNYLGYPGTMGAPFIDYIIADHSLVPSGQERFFSEKVVRLPHSYQCNDDRRNAADDALSRAACGLPDDGFVFCCFNTAWKIQPATFAVWMRLLAAVPGSVLWLLEANPAATRNLRGAARSHGIDPGRLVLAPRVANADHLARHRLADLFLDTLPYNAHTTTSDALWMGLPTVTLEGHAFQARVAASLLRAAGLPELVTTSEAAYEALALDLARDPVRLAAMRARLVAQVKECPLFDSAGFARDMGRALLGMHERRRAGRSPASFDVVA